MDYREPLRGVDSPDKPTQNAATPSLWQQNVSGGNIAPSFTGYVTAGNTTASPNIVWQGQTSGATYSSAAQVLSRT